MGLYMYVSEQDRIAKRKVSDQYVNEEFQEALKFDPSLMIEEYKHRRGFFSSWFRNEEETTYSIYHETPAFDGTAYQARLQASGSGDKKVTVAYLHGIINGVSHSINTINQNKIKENSMSKSIQEYEYALKALMDAIPNDGTWDYQAAWDNAYKLLNSDQKAQVSDTTEDDSNSVAGNTIKTKESGAKLDTKEADLSDVATYVGSFGDYYSPEDKKLMCEAILGYLQKTSSNQH